MTLCKSGGQLGQFAGSFHMRVYKEKLRTTVPTVPPGEYLLWAKIERARKQMTD